MPPELTRDVIEECRIQLKGIMASLADIGVNTGKSEAEVKAVREGIAIDMLCDAALASLPPAEADKPVAKLLNRLESEYAFECEAGPLRLCAEWIALRGLLARPAVQEGFVMVNAKDIEFAADVLIGAMSSGADCEAVGRRLKAAASAPQEPGKS